MARMRHQRLDEAVRKFCAHQGLPFGSDIEVRRHGGAGRRVRGNMQVMRRPFGKQIQGTINVAHMLDHFISSIVEPDLRANQCKAILVSPYEGKVNGNTLLSSVRGWEGLPTPEKIEEMEQNEFAIEATADELELEFEHQAQGWSSLDVARSAIRALVRLYGRETLGEALAAEEARKR